MSATKRAHTRNATIEVRAKPGVNQLCKQLLARRLVEQGVRYVRLFDWGWDFHGTGPAEDIRDGPVAALITDLRQRACSMNR